LRGEKNGIPRKSHQTWWKKYKNVYVREKKQQKHYRKIKPQIECVFLNEKIQAYFLSFCFFKKMTVRPIGIDDDDIDGMGGPNKNVRKNFHEDL